MKIKRVVTNGFRGLPDRTFDLTSTRTGNAANIVLVTGPAGIGKTSFLEAIIAAKEDVGPYGLKRPSISFIRPGEAAAKVRIDWVLTSDEKARVGATESEITSESIFARDEFSITEHNASLAALLGEYDIDPNLGKVEYFHASRRIPRGGAPSMASSGIPEGEKLGRLTRDDAKYARVAQYVVEATVGLHDRDGKRGVARLAEAFAKLCRTRELAGIEKAGRSVAPRFADVRGAIVGIDELSDSERQALLFAVTFIRSGIEHSVVMIDTPELHIPEPEVGVFVAGLAQLGLDNQLVIATGSQGIAARNPDAVIISMG